MAKNSFVVEINFTIYSKYGCKFFKDEGSPNIELNENPSNQRVPVEVMSEAQPK